MWPIVASILLSAVLLNFSFADEPKCPAQLVKNTTVGYNLVEMPNGDLVYLDITENGDLLKRSISDSTTERFEPQPNQIQGSCVLFDRFGQLSLLCKRPDYSDKLLGVGHLNNGKWEFYKFKGDLIMHLFGPIFAQDRSHLYVISENAYRSKQFFVAVLKRSRNKYVLQRKIDIDFIKADANVGRVIPKRNLVAGAVVVGPLIYLFYTGQLVKSEEIGPIDSVAALDIQSGNLTLFHRLDGSIPNFRSYSPPEFHLYQNQIVAVSKGSVAVCTIGEWEWVDYTFRYSWMADGSFGSGSTVTDEGIVYFGYKNGGDATVSLVEVDLA